MLKEKLYSEYQKRYKEYKEKHKKVEMLQADTEVLQAEGINKKADIEAQKKSELDNLAGRKKEIERQLASVKKDGTGSPVVKEYSEAKLRDIERTETSLHSLEQEKKEELSELRRKKKEAVRGLEADKELCQRRLDDLMNGGDGSGFIKQFDEGQLRQQLAKDKARELAKISLQYDASVTKFQNSLQGIDEEYEGILQRELSYIESDPDLCEVYAGLSAKAAGNELPQVIADGMAEPVNDILQRNGISDGRTLAELASGAAPLDDLNQYTPAWLIKFVHVGLPAIVGLGLLLFFGFSGLRLRFVETATNAVVTFLVWVLGAAVVGGIGYGITEAKWGKGIIGGIIGAIIGFWIATRWSVTLPYGVINVVEWLIKGIICILAGVGLYFLNTLTGVGTALIRIGMKLGFLKKAALLQQGYAIWENADCYYVLIRYREIIEQIVADQKQRNTAYLTSEIERLQTEKASAVESLTKKLDQETERKVSEQRASAEASRKQYEQQQMNLIQMQDECMLELSGYDGRIQDKAAEFDEKITETTTAYDKKIAAAKAEIQRLKSGLASDKDSLLAQLESDLSACTADILEKTEQYSRRIAACEQDYEKKIQAVNDQIAELNAAFAGDLAEIKRVFDSINNNTVGFEESQGVLSDYLYLYNEKSEDPKRLTEIRHDKKPIVFLYDLKDTTNVAVATSLFEFMKAVLAGFYTINAIDAFDAIVTDPVSKARKFEQMTQFLTIENDIKKLSDTVQNAMRNVAKTGKHIDEHNKKMASDGEDKVKFCKYIVAEFIVPEESAAQNTNFFDSDLWGTLGDGKENGFLPIFYISYSDWKNTFDDDSKLNSKFILQLKNAIGTSNGAVYKIDAENITIEKVN